MRMRILQVVPHYVPASRYGGPQRVAHGLGRALVRAGHEVVVCTTSLRDETNDLDVPLDKPINVDGVWVYYEAVPFLRYWGFSPALYRRVSKEIPRSDIVLVHAHYQFANWVGARLARKHRKPYLLFAHSSLHRHAVVHKNRVLKRLYLSFLERQNLTQATFIVFNAEEERRLSLFSQKGVVLPSGVELDQFDVPATTGLFRETYPHLIGKTVLLFLGRLDILQKGLDMLLQALSSVVDRFPSIHLVLAGPDENNAAVVLRQMAIELGVAEHVTFTGLVTGVMKTSIMHESDVFVLPSRFEGLSIALLEALVAGKPVIVTNRVGLHEKIEELGAGLVVEPEPDAIAQALLTMSDPDMRGKMQGRAIALVKEKYSWDAIAQTLIDLVKPYVA